MTRHFFSPGAGERFAQARCDAVRTMGCAAKDHDCDFMLVCGDLFESNHVDRRTAVRAAELLKEIPVPVCVLPGNHDPLDASSVYLSPLLLQLPHVHVLDGETPVRFADGTVEVVGMPWRSKRPVRNPALDLLERLSPPPDGMLRVLAAHGNVESFSPSLSDPGFLPMIALESALTSGVAHFIALGDRHSTLEVRARIWYSGSPEPTSFVERDSGNALLVALEEDDVRVEKIQVGTWRFLEREDIPMNHGEDIDQFSSWLDGQSEKPKENTVLKIGLEGALTLAQRERLSEVLERASDLFASLQVDDERLLLRPSDEDFASLHLTGFAGETVAQLRGEAEAGRPASEDALVLLARLAREIGGAS
jgi:DNA repair exonuclease SbcCD nuclease subunit